MALPCPFTLPTCRTTVIAAPCTLVLHHHMHISFNVLMHTSECGAGWQGPYCSAPFIKPTDGEVVVRAAVGGVTSGATPKRPDVSVMGPVSFHVQAVAAQKACPCAEGPLAAAGSHAAGAARPHGLHLAGSQLHVLVLQVHSLSIRHCSLPQV